MTNEAAVAVVVVSYNGERWISACLESLGKSTVSPVVIVVDNNSSDQTASIVQRDFPDVILIKNSSNAGFGGGNNIGIAEALRRKAESVFLLNQDATALPDTIENLLALSKGHGEAGIIAPLHLAHDGRGLDSHVIGYLCGDASKYIDDLYSGTIEPVYEMSFFPAAGWLITKETLERVGGFDPLYFMYGEDMDYCRRVRRAGLKILLAPGAVIRHWHGGPVHSITKTFQARMTEQYWELLLWLKNPETTLTRNMLCAAREQFIKLLRHALYLDFAAFGACAVASLKVLRRIPEIRLHRRLAREKKPFLFLS